MFALPTHGCGQAIGKSYNIGSEETPTMAEYVKLIGRFAMCRISTSIVQKGMTQILKERCKVEEEAQR